MERTIEEIGAKMDALGVWREMSACNWAVKPAGIVFPYFCIVMPGDGNPVKARFLMLEGWQTMHDFVRTRVDRNYGFYSSPVEFPHLELVVLAGGAARLFRHDPGFVPVEATEPQRNLAAKMLWEAYGVMLRVEANPKLPIMFADEKAIFSRVETAKGEWRDVPLEIPAPPPHVEKITFETAELKRAKDLPFEQGAAMHVDFRMLPNVVTRDVPRPRFAYRLLAFDPATREVVINQNVSVAPEFGLKEMWESVPSRFLKAIVARGRVPGEIRVATGRMFRMLRPLCMELPFKLVMQENLQLL